MAAVDAVETMPETCVDGCEIISPNAKHGEDFTEHPND